MAMEEIIGNAAAAEPISAQLGIALIVVVVVLTILKGVALYKAARLREKVWFWILLIFNTAGILPAVYLFIKRDKKI